MLINIGPQHPATHGVLRLVLELDGETVVRCIPHIGYLHCGFEKIGEYRQYNQIIPWTDREDYLNSIGNNVAFALGAERLFGIEITERCKVLRVIAMELSRIASHLVWVGTTCIDIGAFTPFLWSFQERENIYNLLEGWVGARLTTTATRVGGMAADIPDKWLEGLNGFISTFPKTIDEVDRMLTRNAIWVGRTIGLGVMSPDEALNYGLCGPMLRASGVAYDVRKDFPYLDYETYDFDVPVGTNGDVYDRYLVRMEEMRQSVRILEQAVKRLPDGPVNVDDPRVILPPKHKAMSDMESMIHHFKHVMEGPAPAGRRVLRRGGEPEGREGLLLRVRRHGEARALAHPPAELREPLGDPEDGRGPPALRRHRHQRVDRHRHGRNRPMSAHTARRTRPCSSGKRTGGAGRTAHPLPDQDGRRSSRRSGWCRRSAAG